ncbi:MAG: cupin domain-containing protein [Caldilineaceae bacterium]|nr:cupin domain-containing protein [Caldilineaceae bacterium]
MQFVRIFTDADGETHFEDLEIEFAEVNFVPPAPPVLLSQFTPATRWAFFSLPPGWYGDWHPTPKRQIFFYLAGEAEGEVSDGTIRRFQTGDVTIVEDTTGKGHRSRTVGNEPLLTIEEGMSAMLKAGAATGVYTSPKAWGGRWPGITPKRFGNAH